MQTTYTSIDRKGIPPGPRQGEYPSYLYCAINLRDIQLLQTSADENTDIYL